MSFYDDASLILLAGAAAGKDGKAYNVKPVPEYGPELVTNGDFATDSDWDKSSSWSIGGGVATYDKLSSGQELRQLMSSIAVGKTIEVKFDISNIEATKSAYFKLDCSGTPESIFAYTLFSEGTYTYRHTITGGFNRLTFTAINSGNGGAFSIDNISVKEVTNIADFDFSRGSNLSATRVGPTGLIEKGRENLLTQSNDFTTWGLDDVTITSGQGGYDGTNNATKVLGNTNSSRHNLIRSFSLTAPLAISIYVKASGHNYIQIASATTSGQYINFDLSDGSIGNAGGDVISEYVEDIGGGWYRIGFVTGRSLNSYYISLVSSKTAGWLESWAMPNATDGVLIQSAQIEQGLAVTPYIESFATTGKAGLLEDEPRFDYSGGASCPSLLLEPSRTNLVGQSEYFGGSYWTIGGASFVSGLSSPEGLSNAYELKEGANNGFHFFYDNGFTIVNGTSYTMSVFVKYNGRQWFRLLGQFGNSNQQAYFDVQNGVTGSKDAGVVSGIEDYGNGWYRVYLTATSDGTAGRYRGYLAITDGDPSYQGDDTSGVYLYGATFEQGSYPTSYIPNYSGGTITRGSDLTDRGANLTYTGDYTLFMEFEFTKDAVYFLNSTTGHSYTMFFENDDTYFKFGRQSGDAANLYFVNRFDWAAALGTNIKFALVKNGTDAAMFINGTKYAPSTNTLSTGNEILDWRYLNCSTTADRQEQAYIKQLLEFETALSDADCITLTGTSYDTFADMAEALNYTVYE